MKSTALLGSLLIVVPTCVVAQVDSAGPRAGSWAAEVSFGGTVIGGGAAVLRFRNDRSAWLLGLNAQIARRDQGDPFGDGTVGGAGARIGIRTLRSPGARLRPIVGGGILGSYTRVTVTQEAWDVGVYGELGVARFFGESFSLGGTSELQLRRLVRRFGGQRGTETGLALEAVRVRATVYF
jgi:hypothetical protein